jgi:hypothetical protein
MEPSDLLSFLWRTLEDSGKASDADLEWLSQASDCASVMALNLADTVSGIASLVSQDCSSEDVGRVRSGALGGRDLPYLLFTVADTLRTVSGLSAVGHGAQFELRERLAQNLGSDA